MKRIMLVFGTRPEAIKMASVIQRLQESKTLEPVVCVTGQHREMLDQILQVFSLKPDYDLNLMMSDQTLSSLSARILESLDSAIDRAKPDAILVQGDTTTTFCGALSAFYKRIPVGHIEAGLRTGDLLSPFPEELNRVLTTRITRWHFAATERNRQTLVDEGVPKASIFLTGNTVVDALLTVRDRILTGKISPETSALLQRFSRDYILITGHRRENFGEGMRSICNALARIAVAFPDISLVYPVHLNPNVQRPVRELLGNIPNIHLIEPQGYECFVGLMLGSLFIITDSGGVQEEAPSIGKAVLVTREKTERLEGAEQRMQLVGTDESRIFEAAKYLLESEDNRNYLIESVNPYGDGIAAKRIVQVLEQEVAG